MAARGHESFRGWGSGPTTESRPPAEVGPVRHIGVIWRMLRSTRTTPRREVPVARPTRAGSRTGSYRPCVRLAMSALSPSPVLTALALHDESMDAGSPAAARWPCQPVLFLAVISTIGIALVAGVWLARAGMGRAIAAQLMAFAPTIRPRGRG
jgi:hypothetical protein